MYYFSLDPVKVSQKYGCHQTYRDNIIFYRPPQIKQLSASHQKIIHSNLVTTSIIWFCHKCCDGVINYHLQKSKRHNQKHHLFSFLIEKICFFSNGWDFLALSTHFGQDEDQRQIDLCDKVSWTTHAHVNEVDQILTMNFLFSLDALLKILAT